MSTSSISLDGLGDVRFELAWPGDRSPLWHPHRMREDGGGHDGEELDGAGEMHGVLACGCLCLYEKVVQWYWRGREYVRLGMVLGLREMLT